MAQIVGETELLATVPRHCALAILSREPIRHLAVPHRLRRYTVKQHWHERLHRDLGNVWLRQIVADLMPSAVMSPPPRPRSGPSTATAFSRARAGSALRQRRC